MTDFSDLMETQSYLWQPKPASNGKDNTRAIQFPSIQVLWFLQLFRVGII